MLIKFWLESQKGRDHSEGVGAEGMIMLKWMLGI
jgi:hypothetical protein